MAFAHTLDELKAGAELAVQALRCIPLDIQPTTLLRSIRSERGHDHMPAGPDGSAQGIDVVQAISHLGEEMKDGAIMPERIAAIG